MKTKILLVEDDDLIRETIYELLVINNFETISAEDGLEALKNLEHWTPDIIVSDIMMPNCNGYELLNAVRSNQKYNQIPFIFLTAKKPEVELIEASIKGVDGYISKPFKIDELIATIEVKLKRFQELKNHSDLLDIHFDDYLVDEINTPLYLILNNVEFLKDQYDLSNKTEYFETIKDAAEKLNRTFTNVINYQKIIANKYYINKNATIEIEPCIIECLDKIIKINSNYKNEITLDITNALINISRKDILFILLELIDNAFKFSKSNSQIKIIGKEKNKLYQLKIVDSGIGMSKKQLKQVGNLVQFNQERNDIKGIGLGLFLSKKIIEKYEGKININSSEGNGTEVEILIPLA
ncbi:hybrid sensor histidine kinase/response regulator [Flavobacterium sp. UBA6135]|uniref:hybrid sensor histidine kinase/response regulator n=1 Tax=Flavobacterium sp. UBA6135 TaxID=1946553 RepID=UPI0025BF3A0A|nr:response regulator [Flavobacterium sp. UBA6135]